MPLPAEADRPDAETLSAWAKDFCKPDRDEWSVRNYLARFANARDVQIPESIVSCVVELIADPKATEIECRRTNVGTLNSTRLQLGFHNMGIRDLYRTFQRAHKSCSSREAPSS